HKRHAAEAHGAAKPDHARVRQHVGGGDRAHEVRGLVDRRHRPVAAARGQDCDHHGRVGERHQRLAADHAAMPAQPLGEGHAQDSARLPVRGGGGRLVLERLDGKPEILHPGRKYLAQHPPRLVDAECVCFLLLLHERGSSQCGTFHDVTLRFGAAKGTPPGLKMPESGHYPACGTHVPGVVGPKPKRRRAGRRCLAAPPGQCYRASKAGELSMKFARIAAAGLALLAMPTSIVLVRPAHAQMPNINLMPEVKSKTPEEKEQEAAQDKAYKDSLRKIPDAKASTDPWGGVRTDPPKSTTTTPSSKSTSAAKKTKTGSAN